MWRPAMDSPARFGRRSGRWKFFPFVSRVLVLVVFFGAMAGRMDPLSGQEEPVVRILAVVDYIAGTEIYLAVGTEHGVREGDTLQVYDEEGEGGELLGTLAIQSVTERRSVATFVGSPVHVERADLVYLEFPESLVDARALEVADAQQAAVESTAVVAEDEADPAQEAEKTPGPSPRLDGRVSFDMDALQSTTRWGDSPDEEISRTFSTPTFRLQARAQNLPGGLRLNTSMRLSHRTSPGSAVQPVTSLRFYQLDVEKRFEQVPIQLHLGRFHNPYEDYSGYWDGMMIHLGEEGLGGGFAVGYEPELWNEGVSTDRPKISGFLDYDARGEKAEYFGAVSFHTLRPQIEEPDRTFLGLSQRVRLGKAWIRQRLQVDQSLGGNDWTLTRLQLDASVPLAGGLSAHAGWRRWRSYYPILPLGDTGPQHDRASVGLSFWATSGGLSADFSMDRPEGGEEARTASSSFYLRRTPLFGLGFSGSASYWTRGESSSLLLSSEVRRDLGPVDVRGGYRFYENAGDRFESQSHFADLALTLPLGAGFSTRIQGYVQWGDDLESNRILASLRMSF